MTKLEILQAELTRLNLEVLTDVGETLRKKQRRINVIILAIARITGTVVGGTPGPKGENGKDGKGGTNGTDGQNGVDGLKGLKGEKGKDGVDGLQCLQGVKGFDARLLSGKILHPDVNFEKGFNGIGVYNNLADGTIIHTRIPSPVGTPKVTGHVIEIKHLSSAYGGFYPSLPEVLSRENALFIQKFKAKIPVGCTIQYASNPLGDGGGLSWLTPNVGTGKWEDYIVKIQSGSAGPFGTAGHIGLLFNNTQPTPEAPLIWYLSDATVYDVDAVPEKIILDSDATLVEIQQMVGVNGTFLNISDTNTFGENETFSAYTIHKFFYYLLLQTNELKTRIQALENA